MAARLSAIALALLGVLGSAGQPLAQKSDRSAAELMDAVMWNREPIGGPFALIDQNGKRRTDADFRGKVLLVYFGFTYCPDVFRPTCRRLDWQWIGWGGRRCRAADLHHGRSRARYARASERACGHVPRALRRPDRRCRRDRRGRPRLSRLSTPGSRSKSPITPWTTLPSSI